MRAQRETCVADVRSRTDLAAAGRCPAGRARSRLRRGL